MYMPDAISTHLPSAPWLPQPGHEFPLDDLLGRAPQRAHWQGANSSMPRPAHERRRPLVAAAQLHQYLRPQLSLWQRRQRIHAGRCLSRHQAKV